MCMFNTRVESVSKTRIIVGTDGIRQFVIYDNKVEVTKQKPTKPLDSVMKCGRCPSLLVSTRYPYGSNSGFQCNVCNRDLSGHYGSAFSYSYHCKSCKWDVCFECYDKVLDSDAGSFPELLDNLRSRTTPLLTSPFAFSSTNSNSNLNSKFNGPTPAMILPVPAPSDQVDVTGSIDSAKWATKLFKKCTDLFTKPEMLGFGGYRGLSKGMSTNGFLAVEKVGCYKMSKANSVDELSRIDPNTFIANPAIIKILQEKYPTNFSFLIFCLTPGEAYQPLVYTHPLALNSSFQISSSFSSSSSSAAVPIFFTGQAIPNETQRQNQEGQNSIFHALTIPTLHVHDGQFEPKEDDWDHDVFILGGRDLIGPKELTQSTNQLIHYFNGPDADHRDICLLLMQCSSISHWFKDMCLSSVLRWQYKGQGPNSDLIALVH